MTWPGLDIYELITCQGGSEEGGGGGHVSLPTFEKGRGTGGPTCARYLRMD